MNQLPIGRIPEPVLELARTLENAGEKAWIVGGCVRDLLLGRVVSDWDLATTATPARVRTIFRKTIPTGMAHGTVTVLHRGVGYEVTTLRGEGAYSDGRRPDEVYFVSDITEDLERRDFTVNAIALEPSTGHLVDPFGGMADLEARILRAVREPRLRFREDGLRVLRATRFIASLGMTLDPATEAAIPEALDVLAKVSRERVRDEWVKTMKSAAPSRGFAPMKRLGILGVVAPELAKSDDAAYARALRLVDGVTDARVRHAALSLALGSGDEAASIADGLFRRLRYSNDERKTIVELVRLASLPASPPESRVDARRILRRIGREHVPRFVELVAAIAEVDGLEIRGPSWAETAERESKAGMIFETKELVVRGDEVAPFVGGPGPAIRDALEALLAWVDEDPARNDRTLLSARLRETFGTPS